MTELRFDVPASYDVPVEVHDEDLRMIARTLSSQAVTVDAGVYFVLAHLPNGSHLRQSIVVEDEPSAVVELAPRGPERRDSLPRRQDAAQAAPPGTEPIRVSGYLRGHTGEWKKVYHVEIPAHRGAQVPLPPQLDAVGVQQPDGRLTMVWIPGRRLEYFRFAPQLSCDGPGVELVARLAHDAANALLDYLNHDLVADASVMVDSPQLAERLLFDKGADPIAAAAGAYALLRLDELDRLHDWTANLANRFPWLPDGLVAWAEHLARLGDHEKAVKLLRGLPHRGLPVLSIGLTYATDRLRTYSAYWPDDKDLRAALQELTRYAIATDFAATVTTFTGMGPDAPEPGAADHLIALT